MSKIFKNYPYQSLKIDKMPSGVYKHRPFSEEVKKRQSERLEGLSWEKRYGKEVADRMRKIWSKKRKGKTFEELYGIKRAKQMKREISKRTIFKKRLPEEAYKKAVKTRRMRGNYEVKEKTRLKISKTLKKFFKKYPEIKERSIKNLHPGSMKGRHHSEKTKAKLASYKGEKASGWKGGITKLDQQVRSSLEYSKWRLAVLVRDNFTCQNCGQIGQGLNIHHIKSLSIILKTNNIQTFEQASRCQELWNLNNGITLCEECHKQTDSYLNLNKKKCQERE